MVFRPLPVLTALTVASLIILVVLGNWQYGRYSDKLGQEDAPLEPGETITFELIGDPAAPIQNVYGIVDGEAVWRRFALAERKGTGPRFWLAIEATGGIDPIPSQFGDYGEITSTVRIFAREGRSSPRNRPRNSTWFVFDRDGMLDRVGWPDAGPLQVAEPVNLLIRNSEDLSVTRTTINPYGAPEPIDPLPPQRHFGYALTWWGLAAALFVIYWVFHASRGRLKFRI